MADTNPRTTPPSLADLTSRHLSRTSPTDVATEFDAEPYEVVSGFRTEARTAWVEATVALKLLGVSTTPVAPTDWANVVRQMAPVSALPLCIGHFPQLVSDLSGLRTGSFTHPSQASFSVAAYVSKAERSNTQAARLTAAAVARMAGDYATAEKLLADATDDAARANETAALLWQQGKTAEAVAVWESMPDSSVRSFNLGLANLVVGKRVEAVRHLSKAVDGLPETGGWKPLAALYLALTEVAG